MRTSQPLSVTFSLACLFVARVWETPSEVLLAVSTQSLVQGLQPQPSKPSSSASPGWFLLQSACHHLSGLPREKGCPVCPEPIHLQEFVGQSADRVPCFTRKQTLNPCGGRRAVQHVNLFSMSTWVVCQGTLSCPWTSLS